VPSYGEAAAWIGLILVDTACRGQGYGAALFARSIQKARELAGEAVGLDASDLGRPVYLKKGFVDVAPIDRWSGILKTSPASPARKAVTASTFERVAELDTTACSIDRSRLLLHMMEDPAILSFEIPGAGHAFLSPGRLHPHLGPVVATEDAVFETLLDQAGRVLQGAEVVIDAIRTPSSSGILSAHGLRIDRELTRMTLSRPRPLLMGPAARAAVSFTWG